jgi:hypothetical protein
LTRFDIKSANNAANKESVIVMGIAAVVVSRECLPFSFAAHHRPIAFGLKDREGIRDTYRRAIGLVAAGETM